MKHLASILIMTFIFASSAKALELPTIIVSKCTYQGNTLMATSDNVGTQNVSEFFVSEMAMTRLTNPSKFFGQAIIGRSSIQLHVLAEFLNDKIVFKVLVKDSSRTLVRETRSASWIASERPKRYTAHFKSPIVRKIEKLNPDLGSPSWSARFPKNERVINNLEVSCLVRP